MNNSPHNSSDDFTRVPIQLLYNPPHKGDFPPKSFNNWRNGLKNVLSSVESSSMRHERNPIVLFMNNKYVCTYDMYPKAKYHMLLMRRKFNNHIGNLIHVNTLNDVEPSHLHELREFHALGRAIATQISEYHRTHEMSSNQPIIMKLGYHAIPLMEPLHLHIISSDLDSICITKREHVVSFTSPLFFVEAEAVEQHLENAFTSSIALTIRKDRAQSVRHYTPMICVRCGRAAVSVPDWKRHNQQCSKLPTKKESSRRLNSLLGWRRAVILGEGADGAEQIMVGSKRSHS